MLKEYLPILVYFLVAAGIAGILLVFSTFIGKREPTPQKLSPYECGNPETIPFESRFSVKFYLTAMLFLLFDIEVAFFFPWAVIFRHLGWSGLVEMGIFLFVLLFGYFYAWKRGALEWH